MYSTYLNTGLDLQRVRSQIQGVRHQDRTQTRTFSDVQHGSAGTEHVTRQKGITQNLTGNTRETEHCDGTGTRARCLGESKIGKSYAQTRNESKTDRRIIIINVKLNFGQK